MAYNQLDDFLKGRGFGLSCDIENKENNFSDKILEKINSIIEGNKILFSESKNEIEKLFNYIDKIASDDLKKGIKCSDLDKFNIFNNLKIDKSKGIDINIIKDIIKFSNENKFLSRQEHMFSLIYKYLSLFQNTDSSLIINNEVEKNLYKIYIKNGDSEKYGIFYGTGPSSCSEDLVNFYYKECKKHYSSGDIFIDNEFSATHKRYLSDIECEYYGEFKEKHGDNYYKFFKIL